jgi:hypothetical protein
VTVPAKLAGFAAVLAIAFAGAAVAGNAFGPEPDPEAPAMAHQLPAGNDTTVSTAGDGHGSKDVAEPAPGHGAEAHPVRGLAVAENGLRVVVAGPELRRGETERLSFRIVEEDGETVRDFDVEHEKRMHLIIARRDLTGFQHLHPEQAADGTWSTDVRLNDAGSYRLFADFSHGDEAITLASDLRVDGDADLEDLPAPATTATSDLGYEVRLDAGAARAGQPAELRFSIDRNGQPVHTEPYLGAGGHLVALREGDLAFLHVHPTDHADGEAGGHDDSIGFEATFPTEGRYRLFLQFKSEGRVHTVAFTQEVK